MRLIGTENTNGEITLDFPDGTCCLLYSSRVCIWPLVNSLSTTSLYLYKILFCFLISSWILRSSLSSFLIFFTSLPSTVSSSLCFLYSQNISSDSDSVKLLLNILTWLRQESVLIVWFCLQLTGFQSQGWFQYSQTFPTPPVSL